MRSSTLLVSIPFLLTILHGAALHEKGVQGDPQSSVRVEGGELVVQSGAKLLDVVNVFGPHTKRTFQIQNDVAAKLANTWVTLSEPLRVPRSKAEDLLDSLVLANEMIFIPPADPALPWRIADLRAPERFAIRYHAKVLSPEEVASMASRAIYVSVLVPLKNTDAREAAASLRIFYSDNSMNTVTNVGFANQLLVMGTAPTVAQIVKFIHQLDSANLEAAQERRKAESKQVAELSERIAALEKEVRALAERMPAEKPKESR